VRLLLPLLIWWYVVGNSAEITVGTLLIVARYSAVRHIDYVDLLLFPLVHLICPQLCGVTVIALPFIWLRCSCC